MEAMLRDPELQQRADANPSSRQKWPAVSDLYLPSRAPGAKNSTAVDTWFGFGFPAFRGGAGDLLADDHPADHILALVHIGRGMIQSARSGGSHPATASPGRAARCGY